MVSAILNTPSLPMYLTDDTGASVAPSGTTANPTNINTAFLPAGTDRSGSITVGAAQQTLAAANASRRGLTMQNTSAAEMRVTESGAVATATTGYQIAPGGTFRASTNRLISVYGGTTGQTFAATEW